MSTICRNKLMRFRLPLFEASVFLSLGLGLSGCTESNYEPETFETISTSDEALSAKKASKKNVKTDTFYYYLDDKVETIANTNLTQNFTSWYSWYDGQNYFQEIEILSRTQTSIRYRLSMMKDDSFTPTTSGEFFFRSLWQDPDDKIPNLKGLTNTLFTEESNRWTFEEEITGLNPGQFYGLGFMYFDKLMFISRGVTTLNASNESIDSLVCKEAHEIVTSSEASAELKKGGEITFDFYAKDKYGCYLPVSWSLTVNQKTVLDIADYRDDSIHGFRMVDIDSYDFRARNKNRALAEGCASSINNAGCGLQFTATALKRGSSTIVLKVTSPTEGNKELKKKINVKVTK